MPPNKYRNSSSPAINLLPTEILAHVFHLAVDTERCLHYDDEPDQVYPQLLLDSIPRVCSHWRQLSTSISSLWSHIDLVRQADPCDPSYNRARLWVKRARNSPLDIHIYGRSGLPSKSLKVLSHFLTPLIKQACSLKMDGHAPPIVIYSMFNCWFDHGTPGTLKEISLYGCWLFPFDSIAISSSSQPPNWSETLEEFVRPVTVLRLRGGFLPLRSCAYHGLVELQLRVPDTRTSVTQTQLIAVLSSSPELRTLVFSMKITDPIFDGAEFSPVRLEKLENLGVTHSAFCHHGLFLQVLAPGPNPLNMYFEMHGVNLDRCDPETDNFFERSKVTTLYMKGTGVRQWISLSLGLLPHLRTLFLYEHVLRGGFLPMRHARLMMVPPVGLQLNDFYISESIFCGQMFRDFVSSHSIRALGLHDCTFADPGLDPDDQLGRMKRFVADAHPNVKHLDSGDFERALKLWDFAK